MLPRCCLSQQTFFLEGADCLGAYLKLNLATINNDSFGLQVRSPHLFGVSLRKAYVVSVLLAFTSDITYLHGYFLSTIEPYSSCFYSVSQPFWYTESMLQGLPILEIAIVAVIILISITVHEVMHAFVAHALGDTTAQEEGRLTLNPFQHVDLFLTVLLPVVLLLLHLPPIFIAKPVPINPERVKFEEFGTALIGLAGPFTNLAFATVVALGARLAGLEAGFAYHLVELVVYINIVFFVFNMIPFPPLDGSRLLYAFAPDVLRRGMLAIESAGFIALIVFILLLVPFIGPVIGGVTEAIYSFLLR
jgi:Zn-dependent protease